MWSRLPIFDWRVFQLASVLEDIPVHAIKTGMLYDGATIKAVVRRITDHFRAHGTCPLVVDPVIVSTSGHRLLDASATETLLLDLMPLATVITPNIPEAESLLSGSGPVQKIDSISSMKLAAKRLADDCHMAVLVKGGHLVISSTDLDQIDLSDCMIEYSDSCNPDYPKILRAADDAQDGAYLDGIVVDVLFEANSAQRPPKFTIFARRRISTKSTHGTGCTLSAAIACELAKGRSGVFSWSSRDTENKYKCGPQYWRRHDPP